MASIIESHIGSDAGDDYSTLASWWAAKAKDIVATDEVQVALLRGETHSATTLILNMATGTAVTDGTRYYSIKPMTGASYFSGDFDSLTGVPILTTTFGRGIYAYTPFTHIEGICINDITSTTAGRGIVIDSSGAVFERNGINGLQGSNGDVVGLTVATSNTGYAMIIRNNCFNNIYAVTVGKNDGRAIGMHIRGGDTRIYNNTISNIYASSNITTGASTATCIAYGILSEVNSCICYNNIVCFVSATAVLTGATTNKCYLTNSASATIDYNASDDGTATGINSLINVSPTSIFTDISLNTFDCHLLSTASGIDQGMDLTGIVDTDVDGDARPQ